MKKTEKMLFSLFQHSAVKLCLVRISKVSKIDDAYFFCFC